MNTKFFATTALIATMALSGVALATDITKTVTTTVTADTPVISTTVGADVNADVNTDAQITKKSGYYAFDANNNGFLDADEYVTYSYNVIDVNGDKFIADDEWNTYTKVWYKPVQTEDAKAYEFVKLDADADGRIDFEEYANGKDNVIFSTWDVDANGYVDESEYKTVVTTYQTIDTDGVYKW